MYNDTSPVLAVSTLRRPYKWEFILAAQNSASSQLMQGTFVMGNVGGTTTGLGDLGASPTIIHNVILGTSAENSANALNFTITATHPTNSASLSIRRLYAFVELITI
jgi:hypothetical protein